MLRITFLKNVSLKFAWLSALCLQDCLILPFFLAKEYNKTLVPEFYANSDEDISDVGQVFMMLFI